MNRLPNEIVHRIFIQLPLKQRLECTLVNHHWHNAICNCSLLYDVDIKNDKMFNAFVNMLHRQPSRRFQVEIIKLCISRESDKRILYNILPNLRECYCGLIPRYLFQKPYDQFIKLENANPKLEIIEECANCELTRQLLQFGSCYRLKHLQLKFISIENPIKEIFTHLKSAPTLKRLILTDCIIGIDEHEQIHQHTSALETLELHNIVLILVKTPINILPATNVKKFVMTIRTARSFIDYSDWYKYLAQKYTNLEDFQYSDQKLKDLDRQQTMKVYVNGIFPIYKNVGNTIPHFEAKNLPANFNPFKTMDEFGLQVSEVDIVDDREDSLFSQLAGSYQSHFVKSILLINTGITSPILLQNFTSLQSIDITPRQSNTLWNADFTGYLNAFPPTLTTFKGHFFNVFTNGLPTQSNNVQELNLVCNFIYPNLCRIISQCFPKLKNLFLQGVVCQEIKIDLSNHVFDNLYIIAEFHEKYSHRFSITETSKSQFRHHTPEPASSYYGEDITDEELEDVVNIHIKFTSANSLSLHSHHTFERMHYL